MYPLHQHQHQQLSFPLPPSKRSRPNPTSTQINLQSLPLHILHRILRYLHPPTITYANPTLPAYLMPIVHLRTISIYIRDAFDTHVTCIDLTDLSPKQIKPFLLFLPRFTALTSIILRPQLLNPCLYQTWCLYFQSYKANIRHLTFADAPSNICSLFSTFLIPSLYALKTASSTLMQNLPQNSIRNFQLVMDKIPASTLQSCHPHSLFLLYRQGLTQQQAQQLLQTLQAFKTLQTVHLRINCLSPSQYLILPLIPKLRKITLFDSVQSTPQQQHQAIQAITQCTDLSQLQFEWMHTLTDHHIHLIAQSMRNRLTKLSICNCFNLTDHALTLVAQYCPTVELELQFVRDQFGGAALALFADRVSWASGL